MAAEAEAAFRRAASETPHFDTGTVTETWCTTHLPGVNVWGCWSLGDEACLTVSIPLHPRGGGWGLCAGPSSLSPTKWEKDFHWSSTKHSHGPWVHKSAFNSILYWTCRCSLCGSEQMIQQMGLWSYIWLCSDSVSVKGSWLISHCNLLLHLFLALNNICGNICCVIK